MKKLKVSAINKVSGLVNLPGDKSISHRAVMIGAISNGITKAKNVLDCDDCYYTSVAFRSMGISIKKRGAITAIVGKGLRGLRRPKGSLFAGESGTTIRLLAGILSGQNFTSEITAGPLLSKRPMGRIVEPLSMMGVDIKSREGRAPLRITGGDVNNIRYKSEVPSAQVKSAVLFAGLYARGVTSVEEKHRSRDHTERMLKYFGADISIDGLKVSVKGNREMEARNIDIPADISSASFLMAAAILLKGSKIKIGNVGINPTRAGVLNILKRMGADIKIIGKSSEFEPVADIEVKYGRTAGITITKSDIPSIIDELPIIFVLASLSDGLTVIEGAEELRVKETDRIASMGFNLKRAGADFKTDGGRIIIKGVEKLRPSKFKSFGDHRTCMSMAVAALTAGGTSELDDIECVNKSFPGFFKSLSKISK